MRRLLALWLFLGSTLVAVAQQTTVFPIQAGNFEGSINDTTFSVRYSFTLAVGQTATLRMETTSGDLDPFLLLFDSNETLLQSNDDVEQGNRAAQVTYTSEAGGTYFVDATRFDQERGVGRGTYRLRLTLSGTTTDPTANNPLNAAPPFTVPFARLGYEQFGSGQFTEVIDKRYYALAGEQGDFVRLVVTVTQGSADLRVNMLNTDLTIISREAQRDEDEVTVYASLPATGWYLIEVERVSGSGTFILYTTRAADSVIQVGQTIKQEFNPDGTPNTYLFNAKIGDRVFANLTAANADAQLEVTIFDVTLNPLTTRSSDTNTLRVPSIVIPRSAPYILQVRNTRRGSGSFQLALRGIVVDPTKLNATVARYNERYTGEITTTRSMNYYRVTGKAGELVTISMKTPDDLLDPYLILADSNLNELTFNDNVGASRNARITQFALPADGEYFILATRRDLTQGTTTGAYDLELTVGQVTLVNGSITVTLRWQGSADLNLFVRAPDGQIASWSNPTLPSGGNLQIDSNTNCDTPTEQPVEHIYWAGANPPLGDYTLWVWYQNACEGRSDPTLFSLNVVANGETLFNLTPQTSPTLQPDQRFEASFRISSNFVAVVNQGDVTTPSPQQRASQGGDTLLIYGQSVVGTLNDEIFARFYQFSGTAGEVITLSAERITGDLDPIIVLRDANETNLAQNDDANGSNAALTFTLPATGRYVVAVTRFGLRDGLTRGDFRLTLTKQ